MATLEQAKQLLQEHYIAKSKALNSQSYEIAGRRLTRANLNDILIGIKYWEGEVTKLERKAKGRTRARTVVVGR